MRSRSVLQLALALLLPLGLPAASRGKPPLSGDFAHHFRLLETPAPAPPYAFQQGDGRDRAFLEFRGKVLVATFWATWCGICSRELPKLDRLQQQLGAEGLLVIALAQDRAESDAIRSYFAERGIRNLAVYHDREAVLGTLMGIRGVPTSFVIDRAGNLVGVVEGAAAWESPEARTLLRHYLRGADSPAPGAQAPEAGVEPPVAEN